MNATRILLVDDHKILRDGLKVMLEGEAGATIVGEAENGRSAVRLARNLHPDVVVIDVGMPGLNGIDATRQMIADTPKLKVLALSMHSDKRFISGMLQAGASGYLLKESAFSELAAAIQNVIQGHIYLSPKITGTVVNELMRKPKTSEQRPLTAREREVLQLLAEGRSTKEIAWELEVSPKTIETHRKQIMDRLDLHSVAELTKYAIRQGLTSLGD